MIKNYFKIAFRSLWRGKVHSAINIIGLSLGITCCILITLFVNDELTFDRFHAKADRIYRVYGREDWGENQEFFYTTTPFPMGPTLKENFPEVERQVRVLKRGVQLKVGGNTYGEVLTLAGADFFTVFDFKLDKGSPETALQEQSNIIISDWAAKKYFGDADPINQVLSIQVGETFDDFKVAGISNHPINSSIEFYLLVSDANLTKYVDHEMLTSSWFNINPETYVMLREGVNPKTVTDKFPSVFKSVLGEEDFKKSKYAPGLQPLTTIHLDSSFPVGIAPVSNAKYTYILTAIALLILFVGCINFVTLSVGRSMKRAKEVGIRKVVGALRKQLIFQFIGEAIIITSISLIIGFAVADVVLPFFNDLSGKQLSFPFDGFILVVGGALLLIIGLIAGSYPAFVLSGFRPITILKGSIHGGSSKQTLRKVLVGVQLVLSIFLISSTLVMQNQLTFLQNKDLGFDKEQLAVVGFYSKKPGRLHERINDTMEKAEQLKAELSRIPGITAMCASSHDFAKGTWTSISYTDDKGTFRTFNMNTVDDDYVPALKIEMVSGRNFSDNVPADKKRAMIVNEAFVREYGWTNPIGMKIPGKSFGEHEVIGVMKDFNYSSLYTKVEPLAMVENPLIILQGVESINIDNNPIPKLMLRLAPGDMLATMDKVKSVWAKTTDQEFNFSFVDQSIDAQYRSDMNLGKIVSIATILAIVIGSLGLYGLASLAMQNRVKEISIRKVLGATERSLLLLLSKDYVYLIFISLMLSVPITVYLMQGWLASFEYKVTIGWQVFAVAGGISLLIALITISYETIKTTLAQPADTLKCE